MSQETAQEYFEREISKAQLQNEQLSMQNNMLAMGQQGKLTEEKEPGMIKEQLSLGEELKTIDYLLRSFTLETNEQGSKWVAPENEDMVILSPYGIHLFRESMAWYLNKNTLLSAYETEEVLDKMRDFATTLNDAIFLEYELIFQMPTLERCVKELKKRIQDKVTVKKFAMELMGKEIDTKTAVSEVIGEMEGKVEKELLKVRQKLMKNKYKRFTSLLRFVQDTVHSAYNRALGGQERRSLRQHMQITETKGQMAMPTQQKGGLFSGWGKK
jgi:uncharacterized protein Usg